MGQLQAVKQLAVLGGNSGLMCFSYLFGLSWVLTGFFTDKPSAIFLPWSSVSLFDRWQGRNRYSPRILCKLTLLLYKIQVWGTVGEMRSLDSLSWSNMFNTLQPLNSLRFYWHTTFTFIGYNFTHIWCVMIKN